MEKFTFIEAGHHAAVRPSFVRSGDGLAKIRVDVLCRRFYRPMHCLVCEVKERVLLLLLWSSWSLRLFDPRLSFTSVKIRAVFAAHGVIGLEVLVHVESLRSSVGVVVLRSIPVPVEVIKAAACRCVRPRGHSCIPFSESCGCKAGPVLAETISDGRDVARKIHSLAVNNHASLVADRRRETSREEGRSGGRAQVVRVVSLELNACVRERIDVRRVEVARVAVGDVIEAEVVDHEEENVLW